MQYKLTFDQYQQGLESGEFLGLRCHTCHTVMFPPLGVCRNCSGTDLRVTQMSGNPEIDHFWMELSAVKLIVLTHFANCRMFTRR